MPAPKVVNVSVTETLIHLSFTCRLCTEPYTMSVYFLFQLKFPRKHGQDLPQNYLSKYRKPEATGYGFNFWKPQRLRATTHEEETELQGIQKLISLFLLPVFQAFSCDFRRREADSHGCNYTSSASPWRCGRCRKKMFLRELCASLDITWAEQRALLPGQACLHPGWVLRVVVLGFFVGFFFFSGR